MKIKITNIPPYDGEYPFDFEHFTNRDHHTIKKMSGYTPLHYLDAFRDVDMGFIAALGVIAARRSGRFGPIINEDAFWDAEAGGITIEEESADAVPPTIPEAKTDTTRSGEPSPADGESSPVRSLASTGTDS